MSVNPAENPLTLNTIQVASPCSANWDEMTGSDAVRFCGQCAKNVYNLSAMTRSEASALVEKHLDPEAGRLCVRFYRRADGTLLTQDCPVGLQKLRERRIQWRLFKTVATITLITVAGTFSSAQSFGESPSHLEVKGQLQAEPIMGKPMATPQPSPTIAPGGCVRKEPKVDPKAETKSLPNDRGIMGDMVVPASVKKQKKSQKINHQKGNQLNGNQKILPPQVMGEMTAPPPPKTPPPKKTDGQPEPPLMGRIKMPEPPGPKPTPKTPPQAHPG